MKYRNRKDGTQILQNGSSDFWEKQKFIKIMYDSENSCGKFKIKNIIKGLETLVFYQEVFETNPIKIRVIKKKKQIKKGL